MRPDYNAREQALNKALAAAAKVQGHRPLGRRPLAGLRSYQETWFDTTSPFGEALYYITVAHAK